MYSILIQIITPIILLVFLKVMMNSQDDATQRNKSDFTRKSLFPVLLNMPMGMVRNSSYNPFLTSTCRKWFMYNLLPAANSTLGSEMLDRIVSDPMRESCAEINKQVPYFERYSEENFNNYLYSQIKQANLHTFDNGKDIESTHQLPRHR